MTSQQRSNQTRDDVINQVCNCCSERARSGDGEVCEPLPAEADERNDRRVVVVRRRWPHPPPSLHPQQEVAVEWLQASRFRSWRQRTATGSCASTVSSRTTCFDAFFSCTVGCFSFSMATLLSKFRIEYSSMTVVPEMSKPPSTESCVHTLLIETIRDELC